MSSHRSLLTHLVTKTKSRDKPSAASSNRDAYVDITTQPQDSLSCKIYLGILIVFSPRLGER